MSPLISISSSTVLYSAGSRPGILFFLSSRFRHLLSLLSSHQHSQSSQLHSAKNLKYYNMKNRSRSLLQAFLLSWGVNSSLCLILNHRTPCFHTRLHSSAKSDGTNEDQNEALTELLEDSRRSFVKNGLIALSAAVTAGSSFSASARGLVRFPCKDPLLNTYIFMRAGSSLLEIEDVWSTNPLFLTNREAALSDKGEDEVRQACHLLKEAGIAPSIVRYSLAASSIDTANIVGAEFNIGRDRLVPEFNYMDPRAIGGWDFSPKNITEEAVWAMDTDEAGPSGTGGRPPPNEDGTPSETLSDQVVRLTNLLSVLETLYSGDEILLVFPDGTGPALLSCLIGGIPLYRVHELNFQSGEIRQNVDYSSVNTIATSLPPPYYSEIIERGRRELKQLRENPDEERNVKDLKFEEERAVAEAQRKERQELKEREERQNELERRQKLEDERRMKEEQRQERQIQAQKREAERKIARQSQDDDTSNIGATGIAVAGGVLLAASSVLTNSKGTAVIDAVESNPNRNENLLNATVAEVNNADADQIEMRLFDAADADRENVDDAIGTDASRTSVADTDNKHLDQKKNTQSNATGAEASSADASDVDTGSRSLEQPVLMDNDDSEAILGNGDSYDDWGDAWLGTIKEIMNDDPDMSSTIDCE